MTKKKKDEKDHVSGEMIVNGTVKRIVQRTDKRATRLPPKRESERIARNRSEKKKKQERKVLTAERHRYFPVFIIIFLIIVFWNSRVNFISQNRRVYTLLVEFVIKNPNI